MLAMTVTSCKKAKLNREITTSQDLARTQYIWNDILRQAAGAIEIGVVDTNLKWNRCASILRDTLGNPFPISFTLNFGLSNCIDSDGRRRKGRLICELDQDWQERGATVKVSSDGYHINNHEISGSAILTNLGNNDSGFPFFESVISNVVITSDARPSTTWEALQSIVHIEGAETRFFTFDSASNGIYGSSAQLDDVFMISEISSGINSDGRSYSAESTDDLRLDLNCRYITGGIIDLEPEFLTPRIIEYGNGNCDDQGLISIGDKEYTLDIEG